MKINSELQIKSDFQNQIRKEPSNCKAANLAKALLKPNPIPDWHLSFWNKQI